MNILLLGAAGFIGTNLAFQLQKNGNDQITLVDKQKAFFKPIEEMDFKNVTLLESAFGMDTDFDTLTSGQEIIYHLVSTSIPADSNKQIQQELTANVAATSKLMEACVRQKVKRVVFISSGGTVYGKAGACPLSEDEQTYPISAYGLQKITIEKLLYLYWHMYGMDYSVVRLANPYGPYQRPNGLLGAVTTFIYKVLAGESITVYGDGSVVRDFIYIDDAVRAIINIANGQSEHRVFNLGSGRGTSIKQIIDAIQTTLKTEIDVKYLPERTADVPVNYLDISRYEESYGRLNPISLAEGIKKTAAFLSNTYQLKTLI